MKLIILHLDSANKPSPMSEGVVDIQIYSKSYKGINLTTRHTQARRAPQVATIHGAVKETFSAHLTIVHVFHAHASSDTQWMAHVLSHCTLVRYGRIAFISATHDATQFGDSIWPVCISTFQMLVHSDPTDTGRNWHKRWLPPWSSKFMIQPTLNLPIQYSPFSPNCPAQSPIMPNIWSSC
jgi:hypothetical protein